MHISPDEAYLRLKEAKDRPLLEVEDKQKVIKKMIKDREIFYQKSADLIIDNSGKKPETTANEIISKLYS